jgi:hypothetical protein
MKKKSSERKRAGNGKAAPESPLPGRGDGLARPGAGVARKVTHLTPGERVARGRRRATRFHGPAMAVGSRPPTGPTLSHCSRSRLKAGSRSWFPSVTVGCWYRRSRSTGEPH